MLAINTEKSTPTCVVVEIGGPVTTSEVEGVRAAVAAAVEAAGADGAAVVAKVDAMPRLEGFASVEAAGYLKWASFKLHRVAWATDEAFLEEAVKLFGWLVPIDKKIFPADELDAAIAWACRTEEA